MAYRPQYKNKSGKMVDLPLDAETVRGKEVYSKEETDTRIAEKLDEKQITEVNCTHEVEITGFGEEDCNLVIDDQDVVITKIQGQTRRKSLNLFNSDTKYRVEHAYNMSYSFSNGNLTATINGVLWVNLEGYLLDLTPNQTYTISAYIEKNGVSNGVGFRHSDEASEIALLTGTNEGFISLTFTPTESTYFLQFYFSYGSSNAGTISFKNIMLNEGSEPLPYEPYDNNLLNSKCDFVSTGRNLINSDLKSVIANNTYVLGSVSLPKGKYAIRITSSENAGGHTLNIIDEYDNITNITEGILLGNQTAFTLDKDYPNVKLSAFFNSTNTNINIYLMYDDISKLEPYVEDTMKCGLELGQWDYHDNVNHITHRQTSEKWTWIPSQSIANGAAYTYGYRLDIKTFNDTNMGETKGISNWEYNFNMIANPNYNNANSICIFNKILYVFVNGATNEQEARNVLDNNPPSLVYKLSTETTETNVLPSGYKVAYKGMQIQKTDTIPYILTKQYAISLSSQVLNNVAIDRSQQKQIDELYRNKANSSDIYKKSETNSLLNGRFGKWRFENGSLYSGVNPIVGDYYELVGTCTTLGSEDYDTLIIGYDSRPKYFEAGANKVKDIALLEDVPHLFRHQISFGESALSQVSFEIILASPTAINTKDKIKAILTDNYYTSIQRPKIAIGMSLGQGYIYDAIYINNGELFAREITTPSASISIEGICVSIEDKITQIF